MGYGSTLLKEFSELDYFSVYLAEEKINDYEAFKKVLRNNPGIYFYFSKEMKETKKIVLEAVAINGNILGNVSDELRADKDIVLKAIRTNPESIVYADRVLRDNNEIMLETLYLDSNMITFGSYRIKRICEGNDPYLSLMTHIKNEEYKKLNRELKITGEPIKREKINKI